MKKEIWKDIIGYEGLYQVSNLGRVKSLERYSSCGRKLKEKILKQGINNDGYCYVNLYKEGVVKTFKTHRLVCQAFIPNPQNYPCVNHKDENPSNNTIENLEWCSYTYNINYGLRNERASKAISKALKGRVFSQDHKYKLSKVQRKPVAQYNKNGELVGLYTSVKQASELLNIQKDCITRCCNGKHKSAGNYMFRYIKKAG